MEVLPHSVTKQDVVAIGEIGYDEETQREDRYLRRQIEPRQAAKSANYVPYPHGDKKRGIIRTMDIVIE
jgi:predicted metal-dependent TIM-barrel fold hydrolase